MVDAHLSSHLTTTTFAYNEMQSPGCKPLPYSEGCGLNQHHLSSLRSEDVVAAAPSLSKGCGRLIVDDEDNMMSV
jgi:hypothetical protein